MSEVRRSTRQKRTRPSSFDHFKAPHPVDRKYRKDRTSLRMATQQMEDSRIWDMSGTINASNRNGSQNPQNVRPEVEPNTNIHEELDPSVRNMVTQSVEGVQQSLNTMVKETVAKEMTRVYEMISQINDSVRNLAAERQSSGCRPDSEYNHRPDRNVQSGSQPSVDTGNTRTRNTPQPIQPLGNWPIIENRRCRVEKFGVNFDGNQNKLSVEDFVFRIEHLQWSNQLSWAEVLRDFHLLVSGEAQEWYWLQLKSGKIGTWEQLKQALFSRYRTPKSYLEATRNLLDRKQQPGESVDGFFHSFNLLCSKIEHPISEFELVRIAKSNLKESLGRIVFPMFVSSIEQLRIACAEAERNFLRKDNRYVPPHSARLVRQVNEASIEVHRMNDDQNEQEIAAMGVMVTCWNCQKTGHVFKDCISTERHIFCYRCGKADTITPYCQNCKSGNGKRNVVKAGNQRSGEATANQIQQ